MGVNYLCVCTYARTNVWEKGVAVYMLLSFFSPCPPLKAIYLLAVQIKACILCLFAVRRLFFME